MTINWQNAFPIREVPRRINPKNPPHLSSIQRWIRRGIRGIKLETVMIGGMRFTDDEALERFIERATAAADGEADPAQTVAARRRERQRANRELDEAGI